MAPKQRMNVANQAFSKNVVSRGNVAKSMKPEQNKYAAAPWLIGVFVFVVCGSAIFEVFIVKIFNAS
uniref:Ribosome associated membrane protein RAMP4 n=2 Tax=Meloidogyne TaxID=189290 RepID=A0A915P976_9BILA